MRADFHMHTHFSSDAKSSPQEMIEGAIRLGLQTICITDHFDKDYPGEPHEFQLDTEAYFAELCQLQERYQEQIEVRIGVELGLQPHLGAFYDAYVEQYPFDFVIGSVHTVDKQDPYYKEFFEGKTDKEVYAQTFRETVDNIKACTRFDVLGHLDYIVRYGMHREQEYSYFELKEEIDAILRYLIQQGKGLELNTAGFKYGLPFAHPHIDVLKRYRELGGEIITVGSDGHKPEHIAYDFAKATGILRECGFAYYTEFRERKPYFKQLP